MMVTHVTCDTLALLGRIKAHRCFPAVPSGDRECDEFVYAETMKGVDRGWLRGPIKSSDLAAGCSISRRFALWQKTKYRCIDDFFFPGLLVNSTYNIYE